MSETRARIGSRPTCIRSNQMLRCTWGEACSPHKMAPSWGRKICQASATRGTKWESIVQLSCLSTMAQRQRSSIRRSCCILSPIRVVRVNWGPYWRISSKQLMQGSGWSRWRTLHAPFRSTSWQTLSSTIRIWKKRCRRQLLRLTKRLQNALSRCKRIPAKNYCYRSFRLSLYWSRKPTLASSLDEASCPINSYLIKAPLISSVAASKQARVWIRQIVMVFLMWECHWSVIQSLHTCRAQRLQSLSQ